MLDLDLRDKKQIYPKIIQILKNVKNNLDTNKSSSEQVINYLNDFDKRKGLSFNQMLILNNCLFDITKDFKDKRGLINTLIGSLIDYKQSLAINNYHLSKNQTYRLGKTSQLLNDVVNGKAIKNHQVYYYKHFKIQLLTKPLLSKILSQNIAKYSHNLRIIKQQLTLNSEYL